MSHRDDICDLVENIGFQIYYLVGNNVDIKKETLKVVENSKTVTKTVDVEHRNLQIFKVVNNFVGRTVQKADITIPGLTDVATLAHYTMPPIPYVLIDKLDQFFRLVDAQHGTESIVMLTYDTTKDGSDGWGILVPDQENTAAHCNYDPHSIAEIKPEDVMIVGSVHSHPHMAAYASGTDHADQADFDGIHITFGWQKSVNNGATQYHIELQMSGQAYTLKPEDVFENFTIDKEPDPDVVEWSSKVKKELPLHSLGGHQQISNYSPLRRTTTVGTIGDSPRWKNLLKTDQSFVALNLPSNVILFQEAPDVNTKNFHCEVCGAFLDHYNLYDGICDLCDLPIFPKNTQKEKILADLAYYCYQFSIDLDAPIYMLGSNPDNTLFIMKITDSNLASETYKKVSESALDDSDFLLCCGIEDRDVTSCKCSPTIFYEDFESFSSFTEDHNVRVYDNSLSSLCEDCIHYWQPSCPRILDKISDFILDKNIQPSEFSSSINSDDCLFYQLDNSLSQYESDNSTSIYYEQNTNIRYGKYI